MERTMPLLSYIWLECYYALLAATGSSPYNNSSS